MCFLWTSKSRSLLISGSTSSVSRTGLEDSMFQRHIQSHIQFHWGYFQQKKHPLFPLFQPRDQHGYSRLLLHQSSSLIHHHHSSHTRSRSCCCFGCCYYTQPVETRLLSCTVRHIEPSASQAPVTGPNNAVSKVTITCDFGSKRLSTQTIFFGFNKRYMVRVIATRNLELFASSQPKAWWNHISITWWIIGCTHSSQTVIPPVTWVTHPVFVIAVREPSDQYPVWVTVPLPVRKIKLLSLSNWFSLNASNSQGSSRKQGVICENNWTI